MPAVALAFLCSEHEPLAEAPLAPEHSPPDDVSCALALDDDEQQEPDEDFEADADEALSWSQAMALAAPTDTARAATRRVNLRMEILQALGAPFV
jgi:hypothetical protein